MIDGLDILIGTVITGNIVLIHGLGLYALTRYTKTVDGAVRAGLNTVVGMLVGAIILWLLGDIVPTSPTSYLGFYVIVGFVAASAAPYLTRQNTSREYHVVDTALIGLLLLMAEGGVMGVTICGMPWEQPWLLCSTRHVATIRQRLELAPIPRLFRNAYYSSSLICCLIRTAGFEL